MTAEALITRLPTTLPKVLLVDDEPALLDGLRRQLRNRYAITTAPGGNAALALLRAGEKFAVIVSDMRMPEMDGATLLSLAREETPDTVRVLLTGQADVESAIAAINDGQIYRFLTKPCAPDALHAALDDAVRLHSATIAERELLEKTLRGAIQALTDVLALSQPKAFARAQRIARTVQELGVELKLGDRWEVAVAGMLAQLGAVSLPAAVVEKLDRGAALSADERELTSRLPSLSAQLISNIPRLEGLAAAISAYSLPASESELYRREQPTEDPLAILPRIIRVAVDFDYLTCGRVPVVTAIAQLRGRPVYNARVLDALEATQLPRNNSSAPREFKLDELTPGMVLAEDVVADDEVLLVGRGMAVTDAMIRRLTNYTERGDFAGRVLIVDQRM